MRGQIYGCNHSQMAAEVGINCNIVFSLTELRVAPETSFVIRHHRMLPLFDIKHHIELGPIMQPLFDHA